MGDVGPSTQSKYFLSGFNVIWVLERKKSFGLKIVHLTLWEDRCAADVSKWYSFGYHWSGRWRHIALIFHSCSVTDERFQFRLLDQNLVNLWFGDKFGRGGVTLSSKGTGAFNNLSHNKIHLCARFYLRIDCIRKRNATMDVCEAVPNQTLC